MKILVTGGTGFVGSNLVKSLVDEHEVTVVGCQTECKIPGIKKFLQLSLEGIDWRHVYGQDICFHQAANNDTLDEDQDEMWRANVYGPIKLFTTMASGGCKKFVYASSTAVYGNSPAPYVVGETAKEPLNAYGRSKKAFDEFAMKFAETKKVDVIGLRYCNIYGVGEEHKGHRRSYITQLIEQIAKGKAKLFKDGEQKRDWIYIKDVVAANLAAARYEGSGIFNIGTGQPVTFNELVKIIGGDSCEAIYVDNPKEAAYQNHTECDISATKKELGWSPKFHVQEGINDFVNELRKNEAC